MFHVQCSTIHDDNADIGEERGESIDEIVLSIEEQGRQAGIVVVPAPALSEQQRVFHRLVGNDTTTNRVDASDADAIDQVIHIAIVETRVHTADANEVADERAPDDFTLVAHFGRELIVAAVEVEHRNRSEQFHRRGWTHPLAMVISVEDGVGSQIPDHQPKLGGFQQIRLPDERIEFG